MGECPYCGRPWEHRHTCDCVASEPVCDCDQQKDGNRQHNPQDTVGEGDKYKASADAYLDKMVEEHWEWVAGLFENDFDIVGWDKVEYLYKTAMKHGWKHCKEYYNYGEDSTIWG